MSGPDVRARVAVDLGDRSYDVVVGTDLLARLAAVVAVRPRATALVVTQQTVADRYLDALRAGLVGLVDRVEVVLVPDGEGAKSSAVLASLWERAAAVPLTRDDVVVALGGGVVGDLAGFLAATWNRGIDVVQVPTTLLAQVDAAIGGKTGINLPEGKNLVGAFHQPRVVVCDTGVLATLPDRERVAGLGEVVKYALIDASPLPDGSRLLAVLEERAEAARAGDPELLGLLVAHSAAVKASVVGADEREGAARAFLNLGHTHGHVIESLGRYETHLHGEAVAIGIATALRLGVLHGCTPAALVTRYEALARRLGLPVRGPQHPREQVWSVLARDKKAVAGGVRFVLLDDVGRPRVVVPDPAHVDAAVAAVSVAA